MRETNTKKRLTIWIFGHESLPIQRLGGLQFRDRVPIWLASLLTHRTRLHSTVLLVLGFNAGRRRLRFTDNSSGAPIDSPLSQFRRATQFLKLRIADLRSGRAQHGLTVTEFQSASVNPTGFSIFATGIVREGIRNGGVCRAFGYGAVGGGGVLLLLLAFSSGGLVVVAVIGLDWI